MKYTHYAPQAPMTLYVGPRDAVVQAIAEKASTETNCGRKVGVMLTSPVAFMPGDLVIELIAPLAPRLSSLEGNEQGLNTEGGGSRGTAMSHPGFPSTLTSPPFSQGARGEGRGADTCGPTCWLRANPHLDWLKTNEIHDQNSYSPEALQAIANGIYDALRRFDEEGVDLILAQGIPEEGLGQAIMNRLSKAAGGNVIRVGDISVAHSQQKSYD